MRFQRAMKWGELKNLRAQLSCRPDELPCRRRQADVSTRDLPVGLPPSPTAIKFGFKFQVQVLEDKKSRSRPPQPRTKNQEPRTRNPGLKIHRFHTGKASAQSHNPP